MIKFVLTNISQHAETKQGIKLCLFLWEFRLHVHFFVF